MDNRLIFLYFYKSFEQWRTQEAKKSVRLEVYVQAVSRLMSQMLITDATSCDGEGSLVPKFLMSHCREKLLARFIGPVPQTDTGS